MATLDVQVIPNGGLIPTYAAADSAGDECPTGSGVVLHAQNGDTASTTVTMITPQTVDGVLDVEDRDVTVPAGDTTLIPVPDLYRDRDTGLASITYTSTTSLEVAVTRRS